MKNHLRLHVIYMTKLFTYAFLIQSLTMSFLFASDGKAQNKSIEEVKTKISLKNVSVDRAFSIIEKETGFNFVYTDKELNNLPFVSVDRNSLTLYDVLVEIAQQSQLQFKQINNNIHVKKSGFLAKPGATVEISSERATITGNVKDNLGEPLPGVTIIIEGTTQGTVTDVDGKYNISASEGDVLVFSFMGFESRKVTVGNQSVIDIQLSEDLESLEEVVVVGYGTQKRKNLTGSKVLSIRRHLRNSLCPQWNRHFRVMQLVFWFRRQVDPQVQQYLSEFAG